MHGLVKSIVGGISAQQGLSNNPNMRNHQTPPLSKFSQILKVKHMSNIMNIPQILSSCKYKTLIIHKK